MNSTANTECTRCFVCDKRVASGFSTASKCRLIHSKRTLVGVLGNWLGDNFVIVCAEEDVICKSCFNLFNHFDSLYVESMATKNVVLGLLEKKLHLNGGTLVESLPYSEEPMSRIKSKFQSLTPHSKRAKFSDDNEDEEEEEEKGNEEDRSDDENNGDARSRIWLECDKCVYTTNYTNFVKRHVKTPVCVHCDAPLENGACSVRCPVSVKKMMASSVVAKQPIALEAVKFLSHDPQDETLLIAEDENLAEGAVNGEEVSMEDEDSTEEKDAVYLHVVESDHKDASGMRQILTVATEDGSVENMEILLHGDINENSSDHYI